MGWFGRREEVAPAPGLYGPGTVQQAEELLRYRLEHMLTAGIRAEDLNPTFIGSAKELAYSPTRLEFTDTDPSCFYPEEGGTPYRGQERMKRWVDIKISAMDPDSRIKLLYTGPAGTGKTSAAWVTADRIRRWRSAHFGVPLEQQPFFEILPEQFTSKAEFDAFMRWLCAHYPYAILFIDEVHALAKSIGALPLYHTLADTGRPRYPVGERDGWIEVPTSLCWLTATTDPGLLDAALRRRLEPEVRLEPLTDAELVQILLDKPYPIESRAAEEVVRRSSGYAWQSILIYEQARDVAKAGRAPRVEEGHCSVAFDLMGVDELGLLREDRDVIAALLRARSTLADKTVVYSLAEGSLLSAAGVDKATYTDRIKPKLIKHQLLEIRGGQRLTPRALELYGHL